MEGTWTAVGETLTGSGEATGSSADFEYTITDETVIQNLLGISAANPQEGRRQVYVHVEPRAFQGYKDQPAQCALKRLRCALLTKNPATMATTTMGWVVVRSLAPALPVTTSMVWGFVCPKASVQRGITMVPMARAC